jgi:hypothetical protein
MSWTPYVGDPGGELADGHAAVLKANTDPLSRSSRGPGMGSRQRLTTSLAGAVPWSQMTPDQSYFRDTVATGRWGADPEIGAHAPAYMMKRHPDGTVDLVKLEANGKVYLDLGGRGARDVGAGRP